MGYEVPALALALAAGLVIGSPVVFAMLHSRMASQAVGHALYPKKGRAQKDELRLKVLTYNLSIVARLSAKFS